ncbi:MAG: HupE/UreJ family protein, partial [Deltaproteobacteria bacterium]
MSDFHTFLQLGIGHIADLAALDHILFILTLCAIYRPEAWKQILILVTAFTLGHSLTLALAGLELVEVPASLVESAIPVTIMAAGFGLIHGMGFANYFRSLMMAAGDEIVLPLFAFNLGIEIGQIGIVLAYFL